MDGQMFLSPRIHNAVPQTLQTENAQTEPPMNSRLLDPPISPDEGDAALMICGVNASAKDVEQTVRVMRAVKIIPKSSQSAIIPDRKVQLLRKIGNAQAEIGRLNKLLDEIRLEVLAVEK